MGDKSGIQWTDATWNPTTGCDRVSPGCADCYALDLAARLKAMGVAAYQKDGGRASGPGFGLTLHPDRLDLPLRWRKPRRIFVNSMSDLFHEDVPFDFIDRVFAVMALTPQHTYQVLTKRPERMREYMSAPDRFNRTGYAAAGIVSAQERPEQVRIKRAIVAAGIGLPGSWPLRNVILMVSVENQRWADIRIPQLLATPAAAYGLSCEPLLGGLKLKPAWLHSNYADLSSEPVVHASDMIDWVIAGGESAGPARRALVERLPTVTAYDRMSGTSYGYWYKPKPEALEWVRSLRDQCQAAGTPFFFKQWGGRTPKSGGRLLDGRTWDETPR